MLYRGVAPEVLAPARDMDGMVRGVEQRLLAVGLVEPGDRVVVVFGAPIGVPGRTNALRVHEIPILASRAESG